MSLLPTGGGYPRSEVYLSVECSVPTPSGSTPKVLAGKTKSVSAGGLEILLPETLPLRTPVLIQIGEGEPLRAHVVSVDQAIPTSGGPRIPHGVAFEQAVDPAVVSQWRFRSERQVHTRVPARFPVQYAQAGTGGQGTCVNLSRGGDVHRNHQSLLARLAGLPHLHPAEPFPHLLAPRPRGMDAPAGDSGGCPEWNGRAVSRSPAVRKRRDRSGG